LLSEIENQVDLLEIEMRTLFSTAAIFTATVMITAPAFAGDLNETVVESAPAMVVAAPAVTGGDWTGFYAGGQLGYLDVEGTGGAAGAGGDGNTYGVHAGYNYDFGLWVVGAELDYDWSDVDLVFGGATVGSVDSVWRAKLRGGYDFGSTLLYTTVGFAEVDTTLGDASGNFWGVGLSYKVTDQFVMSGEYLKHSFDDIGDVAGLDADADTFSIRASYKF
jgi:outer membrane immunogenic protein